MNQLALRDEKKRLHLTSVHSFSTKNGEPENSNVMRAEDRPIHDWYRFVLSYPPHLVRKYAGSFSLFSGNTVLDPFCGTGTTLVECMKLGINSFGVEPHPMPLLASRVKTNWSLDTATLSPVLEKVEAEELTTNWRP